MEGILYLGVQHNAVYVTYTQDVEHMRPVCLFASICSFDENEHLFCLHVHQKWKESGNLVQPNGVTCSLECTKRCREIITAVRLECSITLHLVILSNIQEIPGNDFFDFRLDLFAFLYVSKM